MAVKLPKFEGKYGLMVTACGQLKGTNVAPGSAGREKKPRVARYQTPSGIAFVRSWFAGKTKRHLHMDCALGSVFRHRPKPKTTHRKAEVLQLIEGVLGKKIDVHITEHFDIPFGDLPKTGLIRSLSPKQKSGDMTVKLTGCSLSLTGVPVTSIRWNIRKEGKKRIVHVCIEAERSETISEQYLPGLCTWMEKQLLLFVLGRREDESA